MLEITNKTHGPIQVMIRSRSGPSPMKFTLLNIPGRGKGLNKYLLQDELVTDYIQRLEQNGLISTKYIES
jgi:hypothetical protein